MLTLSEGFDDQGEGEKAEEEDIEFFEAGEDAAEALEPPEEPLDLIALAVHGFVVLPGLKAIAFGRNYRNKAEIQRQLTGFVVFVGVVHDAGAAVRAAAQCRPAVRALLPHRRLGPAKARRLWPFAHSRQPYESWWSIRRGIFRWPGGRFF